MGSNPIIGTSEKRFYEGKAIKTVDSVDCAASRNKTHEMTLYLPSIRQVISSTHEMTLYLPSIRQVISSALDRSGHVCFVSAAPVIASADCK
jgi:hypothetical protein